MRKFLNILRAELSYALSLLGIVRVRHLPTFVSVEPANFCQLHCPECPVGAGVHKNGTKSKELLSLDKFKHILTQVQNSVHTIQFFFQGEPLLNPQLPDMVKLAQNAGIYTIVSTNALAITPLLAERIMNAGLSRIIVSIDGLSEESYSAYRVGGSLHKALEGLIALRNAKDSIGSSTHIELQMLRLRTNEHEWDTILGKDGHYQPKRSPKCSCHRLWTGCVITVHGDVLPCCYDKSGAFSFGNIFEQPLADIWQGEKANRFRKSILGKRSKPSVCTNCEP